jgi:hypothetical protein
MVDIQLLLVKSVVNTATYFIRKVATAITCQLNLNTNERHSQEAGEN